MKVEIASVNYEMGDEPGACGMTAKEKVQTLRAWSRFLEGAKKNEYVFCFRQFTKALYSHLTLYCAFTAMHNRYVFFDEYFRNPRRTSKFFTQFDERYGYRSLWLGEDWWLTGVICKDINAAMCVIVKLFLDGVYAKMAERVRDRDLVTAKALMAKHGILPPSDATTVEPTQLSFDWESG